MGLLSKAVSSEESRPGGAVLAALEQAFVRSSALRCLVFETECPAERIAAMISPFASVSKIRAGCFLILGKPPLDCELLAHRLTASARGREVLSFSAGDPLEALSILSRCL